MLVGNNVEKIRAAYREVLTEKRAPQRPELWDGNTAARIVKTILEYNL